MNNHPTRNFIYPNPRMNPPMKPAERLFTALSNKKPDRVPFVPKMWFDLAASLTGVPLTDIITNPGVGLQAILDAGLALGFDAVRTFTFFPPRRVREENGIVFEVDSNGRDIGTLDMLGGLATQLFDPGDFDIEDPFKMLHFRLWACEKPLVKTIDDARRICVPKKKDYVAGGWDTCIKKLIERAGDKIALIGDADNPTLSACVALRGPSNALTDMLDDPGLADAIMDKCTEISIERAKFNIDLGLTNIRLNDSTANMNVISPALWRRFIKPRFTRFCSEIHAYHKDVRIYCHICGNVHPVLEDLIETGIDCIGLLDPLGGFTVAQIREKVGDRVALIGGLNTLSFAYGTPGQVMEEARVCIEDGAKNGGYILSSGCVIPRSAKRENLIACVEAVKKHGVY